MYLSPVPKSTCNTSLDGKNYLKTLWEKEIGTAKHHASEQAFLLVSSHRQNCEQDKSADVSRSNSGQNIIKIPDLSYKFKSIAGKQHGWHGGRDWPAWRFHGGNFVWSNQTRSSCWSTWSAHSKFVHLILQDDDPLDAFMAGINAEVSKVELYLVSLCSVNVLWLASSDKKVVPAGEICRGKW